MDHSAIERYIARKREGERTSETTNDPNLQPSLCYYKAWFCYRKDFLKMFERLYQLRNAASPLILNEINYVKTELNEIENVICEELVSLTANDLLNYSKVEYSFKCLDGLVWFGDIRDNIPNVYAAEKILQEMKFYKRRARCLLELYEKLQFDDIDVNAELKNKLIDISVQNVYAVDPVDSSSYCAEFRNAEEIMTNFVKQQLFAYDEIGKMYAARCGEMGEINLWQTFTEQFDYEFKAMRKALIDFRKMMASDFGIYSRFLPECIALMELSFNNIAVVVKRDDRFTSLRSVMDF